jgi:hypothetical protein
MLVDACASEVRRQKPALPEVVRFDRQALLRQTLANS